MCGFSTLFGVMFIEGTLRQADTSPRVMNSLNDTIVYHFPKPQTQEVSSSILSPALPETVGLQILFNLLIFQIYTLVPIP